MKNNILQIKNLSKSYYTKNGEIKAIENISLEINEGDFIAVVGSSGCGKSTLLSIIAALEEKSAGEIIFNKKDFVIGYMLQDDALFDWLTIKDNALLGLEIKHLKNSKNIEYVDQLLKTYDLDNFKLKYPKELSGGMKQRVSLIRTLAIQPDILLLDEPFSALDYQTRLAVSEDVYKIIKKENKTVIMVTHDLAEAISLADKVVVLSKRPSKIKTIYNMKFPNNLTPILKRQTKEFNIYYEQIWKDLDVVV